MTVEAVGDGHASPTANSSQFAPSQFTDLNDQAKLSSSGYITLDAGFEITPATSRHGSGIQSRDVSEPETTVRGDSLRTGRIRCDLTELAAHLVTVKHSVWEEPEPVMVRTPRDPSIATVTSRLGAAAMADLTATAVGATLVRSLALIDNVGAAEAILETGRRHGDVSFDAVVARPWELI